MNKMGKLRKHILRYLTWISYLEHKLDIISKEYYRLKTGKSPPDKVPTRILLREVGLE